MALIAVLLFIAFVSTIGGALVLGIMHLFHLIDIVHLTYWQAIGVSWLLSGAGSLASVARVFIPTTSVKDTLPRAPQRKPPPTPFG